MIPYEELVEALDRYVAKNGGTPQSARVPSSAAAPSSSHAATPLQAVPAAASMAYQAPAEDDDLPSGGFDEPHDPDHLPPLAGDHGGEGDATHVGAMPGGQPAPLPRVIDEDHSNEIDIHDVLDDDEV